MNCWIPNNYQSKSASKDRGDDETFKFIKKKKPGKKVAESFKGFKEIKKL